MAGEFNFISLTYLFSRLAPFIIICYFALQSLFNWDFKGIFYLAGVLFTVFLNIITINMLPPSGGGLEKPAVCTAIEGMPNSPIGQSILGFTFTYLTYIIVMNNTVQSNIQTLVFFPILILLDFIWNRYNKCFDYLQLIPSLLIGGGFGALWGLLIWKVDPDLAILNGISNKEICSMKQTQKFRCRKNI